MIGMNKTLPKKNVHGFIGLGLLLISQILLFLRVEPVVSWFYSLAWWSYILIVDSLIYRIKRNSPILSSPGRFFMLLPWSVTIWLIFEQFNLLLQNWHYTALPKQIWLRWPGYAVAFATVLPGLFETTGLLDALGLFKKAKVKPLTRPQALYVPFTCSGGLMLILSVLLPRYCFPLVWVGFIFLLEPVNHRLGGRSLLGDWTSGTFRTLYLLLLAGLICGFLWEFWNYWAGSKWLYSVPFFSGWHIFEMPVSGYLGFPVFALECYAMYNFVLVCTDRLERERKETVSFQTTKRKWLKIIVYSLMIIFWIFTFNLIDRNTVINFRP
jgi:hypothetical protein